jgi:tetratricopeptide (TPR) repeat protein
VVSDTQQSDTLPIGTQRAPEYIGRRALREHLQEYSRRILDEPICLIFYIQGRGGLGKTRFLTDYLDLAAVADTPIRVCRVIDLIDPANRKPVELQHKLIEGLKEGVSEHGLPADVVEAAFAHYRETLEVFQRSLQHDRRYRDSAAVALNETFAEGWNALSARHPLVVRFDTLEWLFQQDVPRDALPRRDKTRTGVGVIREWTLQVLPKLKHTLVLLSSRPPLRTPLTATPEEQLAANPLAHGLHRQGLLTSEGFQLLQPLRDPADITRYLQIYGVEPGQRNTYIQQITEGSPLLLSLYAECQRPDPPTLFQVPLDDVTTRQAFEQQITDTILNPLSYAVAADEQVSDRDRRRAHEKLVLTFCLYILSYARRGIHAVDLRAILHQADPALVLTDSLLEELKTEVLVKTIPQWRPDGTTDELLFLHDEIWQLIDESGRPRDLGLQDLVLDALCRISRQQIEQVSQVEDPVELLRAMADHVTYTLTRDFGSGYRCYLVYLDHLLGQRNYDDALVLVDLFWWLLMLTVVRPSGPVLIYHDLLAESRQIDYQAVQRHDQLHYVKLLRAQGAYQEAMEEAAALYTQMTDVGVFPTLARLEELGQHLARPSESLGLASADAALLPRDPYLFANLALTWASALILAASPPDYERQVDLLCDVVIALLRSPDSVELLLERTRDQLPALARDEDLLRLRRAYLLGLAYRTRGLLYRQRQDYDRAISDLNEAAQGYQAYANDPISLAETDQPIVAERYLNDSIRDDLALVKTSLATTFAENGYFAWALRISEALCHDSAHKVLPHQRALIFNTYALTYLRLGEYERAREQFKHASEAVQDTQIERAIGLISWTEAQLERRRMNHIRTPLPEAEVLYEHAAQLLAEERDSLRDVRQDQARFLRDLAYWYREQGDLVNQETTYARGIKLVEEAIEQLPTPPQKAMQRADLLETKLAFLNNAQRFAEVRVIMDEVAPLMELEMPLYGQVICGKLAIQRAFLCLSDETQQDHMQALREAAIGLARGYVFGPRHRDQATFEQLIRYWIGLQVPIERISEFVDQILQDPFFVRLEDLPYQRPTQRRWAECWEASMIFFVQFLAELQIRSRLGVVQQALDRAPEAEKLAHARTLLTQTNAIWRQARKATEQAGRPLLSALLDAQREVERLHQNIEAQ